MSGITPTFPGEGCVGFSNVRREGGVARKGGQEGDTEAISDVITRRVIGGCRESNFRQLRP